MKEIDFLPEWYEKERIEHRKHREFYVAIGLIVIFMAVWSIFANGRVAIIKAKNATLESGRMAQLRSQTEYHLAESKYQQLQARQYLLESVQSHMVVSNVIAELSHLLDSGIILRKLEIKAEPIAAGNDKTQIQVVSSADSRTETSDKKVRFKITLAGLASDSAAVAEMINKLEQSDYFFQVIPGFSRNTIVRQYQASEFEITCYLSNYRLES